MPASNANLLKLASIFFYNHRLFVLTQLGKEKLHHNVITNAEVVQWEARTCLLSYIKVVTYFWARKSILSRCVLPANVFNGSFQNKSISLLPNSALASFIERIMR